MESAKQWVARERKQTAEIIPMNFMMFVCSEPGWVEQRADLNLADKLDTHLFLRPSEIFRVRRMNVVRRSSRMTNDTQDHRFVVVAENSG